MGGGDRGYPGVQGGELRVFLAAGEAHNEPRLPVGLVGSSPRRGSRLTELSAFPPRAPTAAASAFARGHENGRPGTRRCRPRRAPSIARGAVIGLLHHGAHVAAAIVAVTIHHAAMFCGFRDIEGYSGVRDVMRSLFFSAACRHKKMACSRKD